ncbi:hypothetical protein, partial [Sphingobacterium multivorum]|uniref:hypothetical protein n=1 Tax=Sphingobacterium multivorum TaxID=28454 RepID=UPI002FDCF295
NKFKSIFQICLHSKVATPSWPQPQLLADLGMAPQLPQKRSPPPEQLWRPDPAFTPCRGHAAYRRGI